MGSFISNICFYTRFEHVRGHGDTSSAVGFARGRMDAEFNEKGVKYITESHCHGIRWRPETVTSQ